MKPLIPFRAKQFTRVHWSAEIGAAKRTTTTKYGMSWRHKGWSADDIASEAMRVTGHCNHVDQPLPPKILYGVDPRLVPAMGREWQKMQPRESYQRKTKSGRVATIERKRRGDAPIMANGIVSLPDAMKEDVWPEYRDVVIEVLKKRYGARLKSIVEHFDEANPHIHFYLVPLVNEPFDVIHDGYAARRGAERAKLRAGAVCGAYKTAMKLWCDWVHDATDGERFGVERGGPGRPRTSRASALKAQVKREEAKVMERLKQLDSLTRQAEAATARAESRAAAAKAFQADEENRSRAKSPDAWAIVDAKNDQLAVLERQLEAAGLKPATRRSTAPRPD